jgi:hypothetical protein
VSAPLGAQNITATNRSGQVSAPASFTLVPDPTGPTVKVLCNDKPCLATPYPKAVEVTISASDGTGSGVSTIRYTTNGGDPAGDHAIEYTQPLTVQSLTHLQVKAFDKAGNSSAPVVLTVNSLANRLMFAAPVSVVVKARARYLNAKVTSNRRGSVLAVMSGTGLKKAERWRFILPSGSSIVQLRLPKAIKRPGTYRIVWTITAGGKKVVRRSVVRLRG